jgi:tRNA-specific 2-thiouridylase
VGGLTKTEVRVHARRLGLRVADKPDSQELCFVPDGDYAAFVERASPAILPGAVVNESGERLAAHAGIHRFTVGQRKGLGVASRDPLYVLRIDAVSGDVTVGPRAALDRSGFTVGGVNWIAHDGSSGWSPASVQIRHRHRPAPGRVRALDESRAQFEFDEPQPAITPGQAAVFYDGDTVVGGGWIANENGTEQNH